MQIKLKKLSAFVLAIMLSFSCISYSIHAAETEDTTITFDSLTITGNTDNYTYENGNLTIIGNGEFTLSGNLSVLSVNDNLNVAIDLNRLKIQSYGNTAVNIGKSSNLTFNLQGSNTIICQTYVTDWTSKAIKGDSNSKLEINANSGEDSLSVQRWGYSGESTCSSIDIRIKGGTVNGISGVTPTYNTNSWVEELSILNWKYGEIPSSPLAIAKMGIPTYAYATKEDGIYNTTVPTNVGTYYVKAAVNENAYLLEAIKEFQIQPS